MISKGWLRIHIVLTFIIAIVSLISIYSSGGDEHFAIIGFSIIIIPILYWLFVLACCWIIKGFNDDKEQNL